MQSSNTRTGLPAMGSRSASSTKTSDAVRRTPPQSGSFGKSMQSAMADPSSSARSVLMMAISESAYRGYKTIQRHILVCFGRLYSKMRQCEARSEHACEVSKWSYACWKMRRTYPDR